MPDRRRHRGPHPQDAALFAEDRVPVLRRAVEELSWLLTRGYNERSAAPLVGNRHALVARQRLAVVHAACSDERRTRRRSRRCALDQLGGRRVVVDGFNVLITVEAALSGGVVLVGRDGALRDLASVRGTYRRVEETPGAIEALGRTLDAAGAESVTWLLDRPVSNSGRLRELLLAAAESEARPWTVELAGDVDRRLVADGGVVATSDGVILDGASASVDVVGPSIRDACPDAWVIDLSEPDSDDVG